MSTEIIPRGENRPFHEHESHSPKMIKEALVSFLLNYNSKATAIEYGRTAKEFLSHTAPLINSLSELDRKHVILYKNRLNEKGLAHKTILKKLSAVSSLCKYLAEEGIVKKDVTYGIIRPKTYNKKETYAFSEDEVRRIFSSMDKSAPCYLAHRALLAVGFYTGFRSSEMRNLKIKDYMDLSGHKILKATVKGDKPLEVPLNPFVIDALNNHLDRLMERGYGENSDCYLFPRLVPLENAPISAKRLSQILDKALKSAGIEKSPARRYSPHSMRATLATHLLNKAEAPLEDVQRLLGHSQPSTTQRYNKRKKSHEKSPVYRIDY